ncbi:MAG TPA: WG repeat-containing protein, partial [Candidatus Ozemobacteraceae bacterium]|nr:WG repeat-containing protein [Candidatus Ozemobacteraceae bacterium]
MMAFLALPCHALREFSWPADMPFKPVNLAIGVWGFDTGHATGPWGIIDEHGQYQVAPLFEKVAIFINGYAPVKKNGKWGFIDTQAQTVLPCQFDAIWQPPQTPGFRMVFTGDGESAEDIIEIDIDADWSGGFAPGVFPVRQGDKWGVIASSGVWIVPAGLDQIHQVQDDRAMVRKNGKYGFLGQDGVMSVEPAYEDVGPFADGLAPFCLDGRWGFIAPAGNVVIQPRFAYAFPFIHGCAIVQEGKMSGVLSTDGNWKLPPVYDSIVRDFADGLFRTERDSHFGLYSPLEGELASPAWDFMSSEPHHLIKVSREGLHGLLARNGTLLLACAYDSVEVDESDLVRLRRNGLWGFYDLSSGRLIEPRYEKIRPFNEGLAAVSMQGRWGYVDRSGGLAIPAQYSWVGDFGNSQAGVMTATACVVINRDGQIVSNPVLDFEPKGKPLPGGSRYARLNGKFGFYNTQNRTFAVPPVLDMARWFKDTGVILAKESGFWRLLIPGNREMSSGWFRDVGNVQEDMCWVELPDNRVGFIDQNGRFAISPVYEAARDFQGDRAGMKQGGKWGFIDHTGKIIVPPVYDQVTGFHRDRAEVQKGNK